MLGAETGNRIDACEYPASAETVIETVGDATLSLPHGSEPVAEALERAGDTTFDSAEDVHLAIYCGVSSKAIGRRGYSDRDPGTVGCDGPDPVSF